MRDFVEDLVSSERVVFFTGAGVSTASGLKDYRSENGIAAQGINLEKDLSHDALYRNPTKFWELWNEHMRFPESTEPNMVHETIAMLGQVRQVAVVTQNIDGLHERAGHTEVVALHGDDGLICTRCKQEVATYPYHNGDCGGMTRPNVILYQERLNKNKMARAQQLMFESDMIVICGTSLEVYPAKLLLNHHRKNRAYCINDRAPNSDHITIPVKMHQGDLVTFFKPLHRALSEQINSF